MRILIASAAIALVVLVGCAARPIEASIAGTYQAITEMEWTFTITLAEDSDGYAVSGVISEDGDVLERRIPCEWDVTDDLVTVRYESGETERFRFSLETPFDSVGLSGTAPGLQPITGDDYPVSDGHVLWLDREVEARLKELRSRQ